MKPGGLKFLRNSYLWQTISLWAFWTVMFVVQKPIFMVCYKGLFGNSSVVDWCRVCLHGFPLDISMAGYLTIVPLVLSLIAVWAPSKLLRKCCRVWLFLASVMVALTFLLNLVLYEYWGFPLDSTPLFYFFSSPSDAMASVGVGEIVLMVFLFCALSLIIYFGACWSFNLKRFCKRRKMLVAHQLWTTLLYILLGGLMFLGIRGGVTVSSMNTGKAYFSERQELNHAAVNPMFSLMESLLHESNFASQYRFLDDKEATELFREMTESGEGVTEQLLTDERPDIYLLILESFSSKLMKTLGGNGVAQELDSLAKQGVLFTHFHANSFRTDRGLVSILSGYPAQPTMSLMKYPRKTATLPSIARSLKGAGYDVRYYYGGDADFTNMRSYLVAQGIDNIVSDVDFPMSERLSKWGVPDHLVFNRLLADEQLADSTSAGGQSAESKSQPVLRIVQTSSSHEPFDVPYNKLSDERLNAFAYADHYVGEFVKKLRASKCWQRSLVVIVPDHLGCYPPHISNYDFSRYEIPLILVGGVVKEPRTVDVVGSQHDLAATLLSQLGIAHEEFLFSKDMLHSGTSHFAFFTVPDAFGIVNEDGRLIFDNKSQKVVAGDSNNDALLKKGQAYLQKLYDDIEKR